MKRLICITLIILTLGSCGIMSPRWLTWFTQVGESTTPEGGPSGSQAFVDADGKYLIDSDSKYFLGATP